MLFILLFYFQLLSLSWGAQINGTVKDQYDQGIVGVEVTLLNHSTQDTLGRFISDELGEWSYNYTTAQELKLQNNLSMEAIGNTWILHDKNISSRTWTWFNELGQELPLIETQIGEHMLEVEFPDASSRVYFVYQDSDRTFKGALASPISYPRTLKLSSQELSIYSEGVFNLHPPQDSLDIYYEFLNKAPVQVTTNFQNQKLSLWRFSVRSLFLNSSNLNASQAWIQVAQSGDTLDFPLNLNMDSLEYSGDFYLDSARDTYLARIYMRDSLGLVQSVGGWYPFDESKPDLFDLPIFENGNAQPTLSASAGDYTSESSFDMAIQLIDYEDLSEEDPQIIWQYQKLHGEPSLDTAWVRQEFNSLEDALAIQIESGDYTMKWQLDYIDPDSNKVSNEGYTYVRESMTDARDGQVYLTRKIAGSNWMIENLNFETEYSFCYEDQVENCEAYGRMYLATSADFPDNICPDGWRIPTRQDWQLFGDSALNQIDGATKIVDTWNGIGDALLISGDRSQAELIGFKGLYGGYRWQDGRFFERSQSAIWWSQTPGTSTMYWSMQVKNNFLKEFEVPPVWALNIRCIQDF